MERRTHLDPKIMHLPNQKTVVVCTGLHVLDGVSQTTQPHRATWSFVSPKGGPSLKATLKGNSLSNTLKELGERIELAGYTLPDAYGLTADTNLTNITVKLKVIHVRINSEGEDTKRFSFQFDRYNFNSYNDAMHNALAIRDLLADFREERKQLQKSTKQARELMRALNLKDLL